MSKTILVDSLDVKVSFEDSQELRDKVFKKVLDYYLEHEAFNGESIMQSDNPQIFAPMVMSEIADEIIKFDVEWKE